MGSIKKRKGLWLIIVVIAIVCAGLIVWLLRPLSVTTMQPTRGAAIDAIYASGAIEPTVMLPIAPRSGGVLTQLIDEGRTVTKGELLARLEDADLVSTVDELDAKARYARAQYTRTQDLVQRGFLARTELDKTRSDLDAAAAALKRAQSQRGFLTLTAPADGLVIRRDGEIGQFIAPGQAVLVLACCAPLRITANVDEEDIGRLRVGQPVVLSSDAIPGRSFDGQVSEITPKGDPVARTYRVRISLAAPDEFHIGMNVDANIIVGKHENALLVPSAVISNSGLWVLLDGRLHRRVVQTGIVGTERTEILNGLDAQAQIVTGPLEGLRDNRRARSKPTADPAVAVEHSADTSR